MNNKQLKQKVYHDIFGNNKSGTGTGNGTGRRLKRVNHFIKVAQLPNIDPNPHTRRFAEQAFIDIEKLVKKGQITRAQYDDYYDNFAWLMQYSRAHIFDSDA